MKRKSIPFLKIAISLVLSVSILMSIFFLANNFQTVSAASLIANGDFETLGTDTNPVPEFIFENGSSIGGYAKIEPDSTSARSGNVLSLNSGTSYDTSGLHSFRIYQTVSVSPYTDYVWEFYMLPTKGGEQYFGVVAGDTVNMYKNSTVPISATVTEGQVTITPNTLSQGAQADLNGDADPNWMCFGSSDGWKKIKVSFNTGANTAISLAYVARASGRSVMFDDWLLTKIQINTEIVNGDFETLGTDTNPVPGFTFNSGSSIGGYAKIEPDSTSARSGNVLSLNSGSSYNSSGLHSFRIYQAINVNQNTDYIWEFYVLPTLGGEQYFGVVAGDTVNAYKNTTLPVTATVALGQMTLTSNTINAGAQSNADGSAADKNWIMFGSSEGWKKVRVRFNSGINNTICLAYVARASGRNVMFDDWSIKKYESSVEILNGDFEDGITSYDYDDKCITAATENTNIYEGSKSVKLITNTHSFNKAYFGQYVQVDKNTFYEWKFMYKSETPDNRVFAGILSADGTKLLASKISSDNGFVASKFAKFSTSRNNYAMNWHEGLTDSEWREYTVTFYSDDNTTVQLALNLAAKGRSGYTDSWSVTKSSVTSIS